MKREKPGREAMSSERGLVVSANGVERETENYIDGREVWCSREKAASNKGCCLVEVRGDGDER
ncbi:hypothetical protein AMTR_s00004p00268940 [Amborella trichopoda]|uniref:Uncharacterized protein n=1 Tax=Amborella trichopoda TaxID=13333 RepID=W1NDM0_AMBTC|nr:hypothetical protein AMTR_s00004p00268940 [Amborella trichopoda]